MHKKLMPLFMPVTCLISTGMASAEMVAHFNFNDAAGTVSDVTGNGHDGTIVGNITFGPGRFAKGMDNDGTGYVALPPASSTEIQISGQASVIVISVFLKEVH